MTKLIAVISLTIIALGMHILAMINGWGLEVKSWWWIIGVNIIMQFIVELLKVIVREK
jgi:hypothetical protein